jgi:hypothetical protein
MASTFLDGPAKEFSGSTHRAPKYLRVVIDRTNGKIDFLDRLEDVPEPNEDIHVYRAVPGTIGGLVFADGYRNGKRWGDSFQSAQYRHLDLPQTVLSPLRDNEAWQAWAESDPFP